MMCLYECPAKPGPVQEPLVIRFRQPVNRLCFGSEPSTRKGLWVGSWVGILDLFAGFVQVYL